MEPIKTARVRVENEWIDIRIPVSLLRDALSKTKDWHILGKVRGTWKDKKIDGLRYQREARQEWK